MIYDTGLYYINDLENDFKKVQDTILLTDPTIGQSLSVHLTKILILTCASYYEQKLQNAYKIYAEKESNKYQDNPHCFNFDKKDKSLYNKFSFGKIETSDDKSSLPETKKMLEPLVFFGEKFHDKIYVEVDRDCNKVRQLKAFQEMFVIRNLIAHNTFVEFTSNKIRDKSFNDIMQLHNEAIKFVDYLTEKFS